MHKAVSKVCWRVPVYFSAIGLIYFFACFVNIQNKQSTIILKNSSFNFTPHQFYIIEIADERVNRNFTALLLEKGKDSPKQFDLKNGAINGIKKFLDNNLHKDTTLKPVLITIKDFELIETLQQNGMVRGDLKINFSFSAQLSYRNKHLLDFNQHISYSRGIDKEVNVESYLRRGIIEGLNYFNNWANLKTF